MDSLDNGKKSEKITKKERTMRHIKHQYFVILFFMLGFSSTMPVVAIPFGGSVISLFTISLIFSIVYLIRSPHKHTIRSTKTDYYYYAWTLIGVISSLFGYVYFIGSEEWQAAAMMYLPKLFVYLFFFILLKNNLNASTLSKSICYGLLWGLIINLIWANIDASLFYILGRSINNDLFQYYINAVNQRDGMLSLTLGPTIRSCGLNDDPANIGLFAPIVAFYGLKSRKYFLYLLSLFSVLASLSHTAFVGIALVTILYLYTSKKRVVAMLSFFFFVFLAWVIISTTNIDVIIQMQEAFVERTEAKSGGAELSGARGSYWINFIPAVISHPLSLIIGTGYYTASYPYLSSGLVVHDFKPYDPEQTFFSMYFNVGLIGFCFFISLILSILKKTKILLENSERLEYLIVYTGIIGSCIAFLGYHYTIYSVFMLFLIAGIVSTHVSYINKKSE